jgi:uncharacterized membrane protein YuzA (DUF378 family)
MSNARVFAFGWSVAVALMGVTQWFGFGPPFGLFSAISKMVYGLHVGIAAVALFGDRFAREDAA